MQRLLGIVVLVCVSNWVLAQDLKWIYNGGGNQSDYGSAITVDPRQNIYDALVFKDSIAINFNEKLYSKGEENVILRKSTILGIRQWFYLLASNGQVIVNDIITDKEDNVYVAGYYKDSLFFRNNLIIEGDSIIPSAFIMKLTEDGNFLWIKSYSTSNAIQIKSLSVDIDNHIVFSGIFMDDADFGNGFTSTSPGNYDVFISWIDEEGNTLSIKTFGGIDNDFINQQVSDNNGNIYLTGEFRSNILLQLNGNDTIIQPAGMTDIYLMKMNKSGEIVYVKTYGSAGIDSGSSLTIDSKGHIILTGKFAQTVSFGDPGFTLQSKGGTDIFLVKLDSLGNTVWANSFGNDQNDAGAKVIVNRRDVIFLTGTFRGKVDFNPSTSYNNSSESKGNSDIFYAVYNQDGTYNQHFSIGGMADEQVNDLALLINGDLISTGGFGANVDFDPSSDDLTLFSNGGLDAFFYSVFICVNPYLKTVKVQKNIICPSETVLIQIEEGYLNSATQWSWQRNSCNSNTFASGDFINIPIDTSTSFYLKGAGGCIVEDLCTKIDIKIFSDSIVTQNIDLCDGEVVTVGNNTYATPGTFIDTLLSSGGCDSIIITNVNVYHKYFITQNLEICNGDSVKVGPHVYKLSGSYTDPLQTINGCDSIIVTHLNILPAVIENAEAIICKGDTVKVREVDYTKGGIYIQSWPNPSGCMDMLIVNIIELETEFPQSVSLCDGEHITVAGNTYSTTGIYIDSLVSSFGCDSIITTQLTVFQHNETVNSFTICPGDSITINGVVYSERDYFIDTLQNINGCDSIVYTSIDMYIVKSPVIQDTILCEGQVLNVGPYIHSEPGFYTDTLNTINGCDSIILTTLNFIPRDYVQTQTICNGETLTIGDQAYSESGTYDIHLTNILGCDSIIHLTLNVIPILETSVNYHICPGETIQIGNHTYSTPGIYMDTLSAVSGCDSIHISNIKFNHVTRNLSYNVCAGESITVNNIKYNQTGTYVDSLKTESGCDSILVIQIAVHPKHVIDTLFEICKGDQIKVGNGTYLNAGKYQQFLTNRYGCDSIINFEIVINFFEPSIAVTNDTLYTIEIPDVKYQWYVCRDNEQIPILGATGPTYKFSITGNYSIAVTYKGCTYFSNCLFVSTSSTDKTITDARPYKMYPNPVYDHLTFQTIDQGKLKLISSSGIVLKELNLTSGEHIIETHSLSPGIYFTEWRLESTGKVYHNRFVKITN